MPRIVKFKHMAFIRCVKAWVRFALRRPKAALDPASMQQHHARLGLAEGLPIEKAGAHVISELKRMDMILTTIKTDLADS